MGHIDDYIAERPDATGAAIAAAYAAVRSLVPTAEDGLKYGMPCLVVAGKGLISVMQTAKHIGVYPFSSGVVTAVGSVPGLVGSSTGALQFALDTPIPNASIETIVRARMAEIAG